MEKNFSNKLHCTDVYIVACARFIEEQSASHEPTALKRVAAQIITISND